MMMMMMTERPRTGRVRVCEVDIAFLRPTYQDENRVYGKSESLDQDHACCSQVQVQVH
jgi:hypothetical protein